MNKPTGKPTIKLPPKPLTEAERLRMIAWLKKNLYGDTNVQKN